MQIQFWISDENSVWCDRSLFHVKIELTDLGQERALDVMDIIFKYIAILLGNQGLYYGSRCQGDRSGFMAWTLKPMVPVVLPKQV